jgi:hypothetical protein
VRPCPQFIEIEAHMSTAATQRQRDEWNASSLV